MALIIGGPKVGLRRFKFIRIISSLINHIWIFIINLNYLGKASPANWLSLFNAYEKVFKANLPYVYRIFYHYYGKKLIHIYRIDQENVGFALFRSGPIQNIYLCSFGILGPFRGKGLAKFLLGQSLAHWKNKEFKTSSLYVLEDNKIAVKMYESLGFVPVSHQDDLIYMVKEL